MRSRHWAWRALQIATVLTAVGNVVVLTQHPFLNPYVDRAKAEARLALERAIKQQLTLDWIEAELNAAVDSEDLSRTELLLDLADRHRLQDREPYMARAKKFVDQEKSLVARLRRCAACMKNPAECRTPSVFLFCSVPLEYTVIGDAKTLIAAGSDAAMGNSVDRMDVTLATVGVGAAALAPLTGGTSYPIKVGATTLRVAKKMGVLGTGLTRILSNVGHIQFRWKNIRRFVSTRELKTIADPRHFQEIAAISKDLGTVAKHARKSDVIFLLRHVEKPEDAVALARVSRVAGKQTREAIEVLGLRKAVRAIQRLSNMATLAIGLLTALVGQLIALFSPLLVNLLRRLFQPSVRAPDEMSQ